MNKLQILYGKALIKNMKLKNNKANILNKIIHKIKLTILKLVFKAFRKFK